ncbi:MAG: ShlB/FhaC/HecB family hemolysin secretion/activation protein [Hormoscilla sp.]
MRDIPIVTMIAWSLIGTPAIAQLREPVEPRPPRLPQPELLPPPEELLQPPTAPPINRPTAPLTGTITVERFEVTGSTVFKAEELAEVTAPFTNRPLSFAELLQVRDEITKYYVDRGYITSGALLPPQTMDSRVIEIAVIEGEVQEIDIKVKGRLNPGYVRSRVELGAKTPLQVDRLVQALQLLQLNPLIENISAELAAGTRSGTSLLEIEVTSAPTFRTVLKYDNGRVPSVGTDRLTLTFQETSLLGLGDALTLSYTNTDGSNALDEASYRIPINARNGTLGLFFKISENEVIEEPFDQLDIESDSREYEISYRQPLIETPTRELALGLIAARRESNTQLLGEPFPLSPGSNEDGETRVSALRFFQEWTNRGREEVFAARSQFSVGIGAFEATVNDEPPDSRFFSWRGQLQYLRVLGPDAALLLRSDLQLSPEPLVPIEQFGLGGLNSVRGYRQDAILADNGIFASAEVRLPIARISDWNTVLQFTPFLEIGTGWNTDRANPQPNNLYSVGMGLRLEVANKLTARFDWGIPLGNLLPNRRTLQENGLYFTIEYRPFDRQR